MSEKEGKTTVSLDAKDLMQVNAAVIAGLLVLLTLVSIQPAAQVPIALPIKPSTQPSLQITVVREVALASVRLWAISAIIPFSLSAYYVTFKISLKRSKDVLGIEANPAKLTTRFERTLLASTIGFIYLIFSAVVAIIFVILQLMHVF